MREQNGLPMKLPEWPRDRVLAATPGMALFF
jgi:hypothetical protein